MTKEKKIRLKYTIGILLLITIVVMDFMRVPIQDNFVSLSEWIIGSIFLGYTVKTISNIFKK